MEFGTEKKTYTAEEFDTLPSTRNPQQTDQFAKSLYPYIEASDYLLVARLQSEHQGWLPPDAWNWLNSKFY